jgi:uncharacterized membrane protein HdeD (DUF308 family)
MNSGSISIWFFIGVSLLFNGAVILVTGVYELVHPPEYPVVLYQMHASIWWGAVLLLSGIVYCVRYFPSRVANPLQ